MLQLIVSTATASFTDKQGLRIRLRDAADAASATPVKTQEDAWKALERQKWGIDDNASATAIALVKMGPKL